MFSAGRFWCSFILLSALSLAIENEVVREYQKRKGLSNPLPATFKTAWQMEWHSPWWIRLILFVLVGLSLWASFKLAEKPRDTGESATRTQPNAS